jgi:ureidoglycolate lyase
MPIFDFLNPKLPAGLPTVRMPVVDADDANLQGYGRLVSDAAQCQVEIVRWPSVGTRPVDEDTGDEAGTTEGVFVSEWKGDILYGRNQAVSGHYILAYATDPAAARESTARDPSRMLLWHANYHPDGGQLFFPLDPGPFYVPLALPGDDVTPERFVCFRFAGDRGLYIHPGIWHEGVLADAIVAHAFGHGFHPQHTERLAAYWCEAWGGPPSYSQQLGSESSVVRMHSGNGPHEDMDRRAIDCFDLALDDIGLAAGPLRSALHDYFVWTTTVTMAAYPRGKGLVPGDLRMPRWSWDGLQP